VKPLSTCQPFLQESQNSLYCTLFLLLFVVCVQELFEPLHLMYTSLLSTGDESTANHKLLDTLRQVGGAQQRAALNE
jgi:phosphoenolpyruvate carboxylase